MKLDLLDVENRSEVFGARVALYMAAKKWDMVAAIASHLRSGDQLVSYKVTQKLYSGQVTVIVGATVNGRKTEARWSFNVGSKEAKEASPAKEAS